MNEVKRLQEKDIEDFVWISTNAYCGFGELNVLSERYRELFSSLVKEFDGDNLFGVFRKEKLLGGMRLIDYNMMLLSTRAKVGGIGSVAVDLLHKKERIAKQLIEFACKYFKEKGMSMVTLYPFRADFYKKMGFGYGVEMRQYKIEPKYFPKGPSKEHIEFLKEGDKDAIIGCYNRVLEKNNGMMEKTDLCLKGLFRSDKRIIGYKKDGKILGYMSFSFKNKHILKNDIVVNELIYVNHEVLLELCTFLNSQGDQFDRVIINTPDEYFHYMVNNPANGEYEAKNSIINEYSALDLGIMYRVLDVKKLFEILSKHNFNNQNCRLKLTTFDDFFAVNNGSIILDFKDGKVDICNGNDFEVEIELKVADFSSLVMGAVNLKTLVQYGLAKVSHEGYIDTVNNIFMTDKKPVCTTHF